MGRVRRKQPREIAAALRRGKTARANSIAISSREIEQRLNSKAIAAAYETGYAFHRKAVRESMMLLAWVLRPDYWDAQVPNVGI
jgi:hypothetical protein